MAQAMWKTGETSTSEETKGITVHVRVMLKKDFPDPMGENLKGKLEKEGIKATKVVTGKHFQIIVAVKTKPAARKIVTTACKKLLASDVIEEFEIEFPPNKKKSRR